ncbi:hypothetical protein FTUN_5675 [Frigoriglobus tundricola]|uniref:Uncharacterized protein n=1 Tax=Frigoriglobus tundricola TaxID=2774151 RepID=A0A6M5YVP2_9BACT|nr:hypothetical protein FTUN_5675 [Frigoriglobus tundricola]
MPNEAHGKVIELPVRADSAYRESTQARWVLARYGLIHGPVGAVCVLCWWPRLSSPCAGKPRRESLGHKNPTAATGS